MNVIKWIIGTAKGMIRGQHNELIVVENLDLKEMSEHTSYLDAKTSSKGGIMESQ